MLKSTVGQSLNWARSWGMWEFMEMSLLVIYLINLTSLCLTIAFLHCFYVCLMIKGKPTQLYCEALRDAEKNLLRGGGGREESLLSSATALFFPAFQEQAMFHPLPPPQLVLGRAAEFSSLFLEVTETRSIEKTAFFCSLSLLQWKRWADLDPACSLARINPHCNQYKICPFRKVPCVWKPLWTAVSHQQQMHSWYNSDCPRLCWDPFYCFFLPIRVEAEHLFSQAVPVASSVFSEGSAFCRAESSATDFPRTALVKKNLERAIPAWCRVLMHRINDFVLLEPYNNHAIG